MKDLEKSLKEVPSCKLSFPSTSQLYQMELMVTPTTGLYVGGMYKFTISVPPEYNNVVSFEKFLLLFEIKFNNHNFKPPQVKCLTRVWHPNISEEGAICLSLLRQNSLDGFGKFFKLILKI